MSRVPRELDPRGFPWSQRAHGAELVGDLHGRAPGLLSFLYLLPSRLGSGPLASAGAGREEWEAFQPPVSGAIQGKRTRSLRLRPRGFLEDRPGRTARSCVNSPSPKTPERPFSTSFLLFYLCSKNSRRPSPRAKPARLPLSCHRPGETQHKMYPKGGEETCVCVHLFGSVSDLLVLK